MANENEQMWLPRIDPIRCMGCGDCIATCPTGALGWESGKAALVQPEFCLYCAVCEEFCPVSAIELPYLVVKKVDTRESER